MSVGDSAAGVVQAHLPKSIVGGAGAGSARAAEANPSPTKAEIHIVRMRRPQT